MLKPKNISIKKVPEPEPLQAPKKTRNSRKSLKIARK